MKIFRTLLLGAAATTLLSQFASAELPISKQALAQIDATIEFCSQQKPEAAQNFKDTAAAIAKQLPAKDLESARASDDYKSARKSIIDDLQKLNKEAVNNMCGGTAASKEDSKESSPKK